MFKQLVFTYRVVYTWMIKQGIPYVDRETFIHPHELLNVILVELISTETNISRSEYSNVILFSNYLCIEKSTIGQVRSYETPRLLVNQMTFF